MEINHPNFGKAKQKEISHQQEPSVHTVMPPSDENFMDEMSKLVNQQGPISLPPVEINDKLIQEQLDKKAVLEKLVMFKEPHYKKVGLNGITFRLKLLTAEENTEVYSMIRKFASEDQVTRSPLILLAASLVDANGIKIEDTYVGPEVDSPMLKRYHELCKWHMPVINALVGAYSEFTLSVEKEYSEDFLAKSPKMPSTE